MTTALKGYSSAQALRTDAPQSVRGRAFGMGMVGWLLVLCLCLLALFGVAMLYSVAGDPTRYTSATQWWERGSWEPWAGRHATRFAAGLVLMFALALLPIQIWRRLAFPAYLGSLVLLIGVEFFGETNMGATRWLVIGPLEVQPSELMKLALVLMLARYYDGLKPGAVTQTFNHLPALAMILVPAALIVKQPDLGTALLVTAAGGVIVLLSGIPWRHVAGGALLGAVGLVLLYSYGLHDYQRARIWTFLNPGEDKLGAGYHVNQSLIAIGSGGVEGKGFGQGTQTQLDFLPEKHTDFIFTVIGEELGFIGGIALLSLIAVILGLCVIIALQARHVFGRLAVMGAASTFAFYVIINVAMVMGLVPVVGVPLPLVSYGGTVMLAVMAGFGLILSVRVHQDTEMPAPRGLVS